MNKIIYLVLLIAFTAVSCSKNKSDDSPRKNTKTTESKDSMIYGLSCDGTNDSVLVFLPFGTNQPLITFDIEDAKYYGRIIGQPKIGDWVGVMVNPKDSTEATMVVDLDQLKGTWTYPVQPTWKDASKLSARAIRRKLNEIPDSLRGAYLIPREYGFSLKRSSVAEAVGRVRSGSSLTDDSPVEYPPVPNITEWHCRNGHLILTYSSHRNMPGVKEEGKEILSYDTLEFVSMTDDSLIVRRHDNTYIHYHRRANAQEANAAAQKAAQKTASVVK